jgi:type II secretory pathway component PulF
VQGALAAFSALDDGRHRAEFYRMWTVGHSAGFPHPKSLETMGRRPSPDTERVRKWLLDGTTRGRSIAELLRSGGARFEEFERALLTQGEESGRLDDALRLLGEFYTKKHQLMLWVKKKMAYPLFTALAACFIAPLPLLFMGRTVAYVVFAFAAAALLLGASGGLIAAVAARYGRKPPLARARMARALSTAIEAGLTLPRAVRLAADASASPEIRAFVQRQSEKQLSARSMAVSLAACPHLTPDFLGMLDVAERTGDFTPLARLAELYEKGFR